MTEPALIRGVIAGSRWYAAAGLCLCGVVALLSMLVAHVTNVPAVLMALLIGAALAHSRNIAPFAKGTGFAARNILRIGIALIGVRLSFDQIASLGFSTILVAAGGVLLTLSGGFLIARALGLPRSRAILSAGAVGICGASAALAISTILPDDADLERETVSTVALVTLLSTIAMLTYPVVSRFLDLGHLEAGIFFGASIHDVTQVAGAGAMISPDTTTAAVATKLVRIACLAPVVAIMALMATGRGQGAVGASRPSAAPGFLIGFVVLALTANLGLVPELLRHFLSNGATFCLVVATAALGMKISLPSLFAEGWRPVVAMLVQTLLLAGYVLGCIYIFKL